jgi:ferredoxin
VSHHDERSVHGLRIVIDREQCVGFGDCVERAPDAFVLDEDGIAVFVNPAAVEPGRLLDACDACPVDAIIVHDARGTQLVPAPSTTPSPKFLRPGL